MNQYFSSVNGYQGYKERREKMMKRVKPFAFESRELVKPPRIREQRVEADQRARDAAATEHRWHPYKATPVPPSTFMNKYELMVEEWCQRKAAIEMMSRERARIAKDDAAFVRLSAQSLRSTREGLMGVVYGPDGKPVTRNELRRRARSADVMRSRHKSTGAPLREVPLEVRMKLWPALSDHERLRRERIKFLATVRKSEVDAEVRQVMPLLTSPSPARCYDAASPGGIDMAALLAAANGENVGAAVPRYGVGQAVLSSKRTPFPTAEAGALAAALSPSTVPPPPAVVSGLSPRTSVPPPPPPCVPTPQPPTGAAMAVPAPAPSLPAAVPEPPPGAVVLPPLPTAPTTVPTAPPPFFPTGSAVPAPPSAGPPPPPAPAPAASAPSPASTAAAAATVSSATAGAAAGSKAAKQSTQQDREALWRRYNPQLTFKPNVRPGVPNFEALWAHNKATLAQKKLQHPTTVPQPFDLTPSARDNKIVGRRPARSTSAPGPPRRHGSPSGGKRRQAADTPSMPAGNVMALASPRSGAPRGTRAHALRTQAIYSHYVKQSEEQSVTAEGDEQYWKAVAQRQREVRKRLSAYLVDHHAEHERAITEKVRALRAAMRESEKAAKERLAEMKQRVAEMPPVFAEPVHLNEQSKVRVEAEKIVLQSLKEAGLDGATIKRILTSPLVDATDAATDALGAEAADTSRIDGDGVSPIAAGEEDSKAQGAPSSAAAHSPLSKHAEASKHDSSGSSSSSDSDASSSRSSEGSIKKSPPGSSVTRRSSCPSASTLSVPAPPKPVVADRTSAPEYSDDSFESSDSD
ncbi:conserved hypothetical protein [Leishmania infantum JPCM5]|uniref:Uncharacterized_protein_family_UPF0564_-_putative n=2 Tax=Leishmania infantum TaxID=5671 RepID=A0A6L0XSC7_LEIIN|nr:conserved hypothetical protein [Leishmania infantum JPCM5]CAC9528006.1 Uncharacterised_protein_family_UPF0564_-_putative [Leishmania infantum]CAM71111.1 conserved hypothetical protein [Leishmania infantum JPCM5]SUZ44934.1 Uncharacterised_protein_family_UPF0564_-_putative [Leishmania infantum]|eukprot:XP_001468036.1 conserved hypothetical protein [Leishmania infantum JPCM5]